MAALRSHIDALNSHCASSAFSQIKLDEDTVSIQVKAEGCKGTVNISLHERSSYPRTGGLAFADGSDQLVAAVESVSEAIGEKASLDHVLRLLRSTEHQQEQWRTLAGKDRGRRLVRSAP